MKNGITPEILESEWNAYVFDKADAGITVPNSSKNILGAAFCLWCDAPAAETPEEILKHITPYLYAAGKAIN